MSYCLAPKRWNFFSDKTCMASPAGVDVLTRFLEKKMSLFTICRNIHMHIYYALLINAECNIDFVTSAKGICFLYPQSLKHH